MSYTTQDFKTHIKNLQQLLNTQNYVNENPIVLAIDGIYGENTTNAVKQFERNNNFPITGQMDFERYQTLVNSLDENVLMSNTNQNPLYLNFNIPLAIGSGGNNVYIVQAVISNLSERYINLADQQITGIYDDNTAQNILELQLIFGLPQTGVLDNTTWGYITRINNIL